MKGRAWSRDDDRAICHMAHDRVKASIIAVKMGRPTNAVSWRLSYLRAMFLDPYGPAFPAQHDDTIRTMTHAGADDQEIAAAIGYEREVVVHRRRYFGWHRKAPPSPGCVPREPASVDRSEIVGPVVASFEVVRDWQRRLAPEAATLAEVNAVRAEWGLPDFVIPRRSVSQHAASAIRRVMQEVQS